ncbi:MAG: hypothetical protein Q4G71_14870 [Pseudomonadota bacterium]|nr:hypothetical protein [Pseudomonadota bacterium]
MEFKIGRDFVWRDLITLVKAKADRQLNYDVYGKSFYFSANDLCRVDRPIDVNDSDEEIYPNTVVATGLTFLVSAENLQDVIDHALGQNTHVSIETIIAAIQYYSKHDDFMQID